MTKKDLVTKVIFNILKIWGCSWLAYGIVTIPWYLFSAINGSETQAEKLFNEIVFVIVAGLVCCAFLFLFSYRESYKEGHIPQTKSFMILGAILPAVLYILICVISKSPFFAIQQIQLVTCMIGTQEIITRGTIFLASLIFTPFFTAALYLGAYVGRKKRAKDKEELTSQPKE